jgi:diaminohydroxyphosphoribosylaminopyrimidine deaminase/5-amino-6-(5-phosphoribosylamino)uracil reductase
LSRDTTGDRIQTKMWMEQAIGLLAGSSPHPNPRVAALIIDKHGRVVGEGVHVAPGEAHAEVVALDAAGRKAAGGIAVVTLEPCDHHARTPPCTDALIAAGVSAVVVGATDPDSRVAGRGISRLREAGIDVLVDVLADRVEAADPGYFHHRRSGRPLVTLKLAGTLDGQVAAADGTSQWITSDEARADAHALRAATDAVMVGAGTLRADDPRLDVRLPEFDGRQPRPVVVAGREPVPGEAAVYARHPLMYAPQRFEPPPGVELEVMWHPTGVDVEAMMKDLGARGVLDLLVEGGPSLARSLLHAGVVDRVVVYVAGKLAGGAGLPMFGGEWRTLAEAVDLRITSVVRLGPDVRIDGSIEKPTEVR